MNDLNEPSKKGNEVATLLPERKKEFTTDLHPKKSILMTVCSFILITEFCERLAYYGLTGSLPIFFRKNLGLSTLLATELSSFFSSVVYITPLIGAYIADTYLGRFWTIFLFCAWYLVGLAGCVLLAYPADILGEEIRRWLFMTCLFAGVGLGAGGIKPNVVVLGADQFDISDPTESKQKDSFFNWFYWSINIGATFSFGILSNIAVNGIPQWGIPVNYGFFVSFLIPLIIFSIALLVFFKGKSRYKQVPPQGSSLKVFTGVIFSASSSSHRGRILTSGFFLLTPAVILTIISYFITNDAWHLIIALTGALLIFYGSLVLILLSASGNFDWLKYANKEEYGGLYSAQEIKDVKDVLRLLPYLSFFIMFWAVYGQQSNNFIFQGCQMDLRIGSSQISSAMLTLIDTLVILIFIPIFDKLLYPFVENSLGIKITSLRKIGMGFFFSFLAMVTAGLVEVQRKQHKIVPGISSNCATSNEFLPMSTMTIWWQTPQYALVGIGEILTSISGYDLFYSEVPESMRSVCQALNLFTTTLGYIVGSVINSILSDWVTTDLNAGELQYIFYAVAGLMLLNLLAFLIVSQNFTYKNHGHLDEEITHTSEVLVQDSAF